MPNLPPKFAEWPGDAVDLDRDEVAALYANGFAGVYQDDKAKAALWNGVVAEGGFAKAHDAAAAFGLAGNGAGKLSLTFMAIYKIWPGCLPGGAQARGDCVSWSTRNAALATLACEIIDGKTDEETGKIEGAPDVPASGIKYGVLSTEAIYWWRDHGGDGWSCDHAASVVKSESGMWIRKPYDEFGFDLSQYSGSLAGKWGSTNPPSEIKTFGTQHRIRTVTECETFEEIRDFIASGYGISTCGGEGWSSSRDANGFSRRSGSWSHALAYLGVDDRQEIKDLYGEPLILIQNSWGEWNSGGRRILGTDIEIPIGSFWAKWSDCSRRYSIAFSSASGWPARDLSSWGLGGKTW